MTGYVWPSETQDFNLTVSEDKTWSEVLSAAGVTEANKETANLVITAENNPKITFDIVDSVLYGLTVNGSAVFSAGDEVYGSGAQSFGKTLLATSMKTTTEGCLSLPNVEFEVKDGWKGAFTTSASDIKLYAQNAETISINIGGGSGGTTAIADSPAANLVSGSGYCGLYPTPGNAWNNISGRWSGGSKTVTLTGAKAFDGETTTTRPTVQLSGTANNTYQWGGVTESFLRGYLDDTGGVSVQIVGVPYSEYDVIVYATSDSRLALNYFTINGSDYTCGSDGIATVGQSSWGEGETTTAQLGKNAMLVQGVTGSTLTISGTRAAPSSGPRVTVCAVQIINKGTIESSDWTANLDATTTFSGGVGAGLSGQSGTWVNNALASIIITNKASDATLTLDGEITAGVLKVVGGEGKRLSIDKDSGATLDIAVYDLTESAEETAFLFDPDFSKVNAGGNLIVFLDQFHAARLLRQPLVPIGAQRGQLLAVVRLAQIFADCRGEEASLMFAAGFHNFTSRHGVQLLTGELAVLMLREVRRRLFCGQLDAVLLREGYELLRRLAGLRLCQHFLRDLFAVGFHDVFLLLKETMIKSIRASAEGFFRLSRKRPRRRSIATSRGI